MTMTVIDREAALSAVGAVLGKLVADDALDDDIEAKLVAIIDMIDEELPPRETSTADDVVYVSGILGESPEVHGYGGSNRTHCGRTVRWTTGHAIMLERHAVMFARRCSRCTTGAVHPDVPADAELRSRDPQASVREGWGD